MRTFRKGDRVTSDSKRLWVVESGPFRVTDLTRADGGHNAYVVKEEGADRFAWVNAARLHPRKLEGYKPGDWAEIPGQPGARVKLAMPFAQPDGSRSWVVANSAGRFVMASERSLNVVERPSETRKDAKVAEAAAHLKDVVEHSGYAMIGARMYPLGPEVVYVDRYGCHWGAELVSGKALARLRVDGRPNTGSPTLQSVINSYGPIKLKH